MALIQITTSVRHNDLLQPKQESGGSFRKFHANIKTVASTCSFQSTYSQSSCTIPINFVNFASRLPLSKKSRILKRMKMNLNQKQALLLLSLAVVRQRLSKCSLNNIYQV